MMSQRKGPIRVSLPSTIKCKQPYKTISWIEPLLSCRVENAEKNKTNKCSSFEVQFLYDHNYEPAQLLCE